MSRISASLCVPRPGYGRTGTHNVPFFSKIVIITVKVMQNLHDRVIAMSGRADRRNIGRLRVFSLMSAKWRADRNRASVALIKSEFQVYLNFGLACSEFYDYALVHCLLLQLVAKSIIGEGRGRLALTLWLMFAQLRPVRVRLQMNCEVHKCASVCVWT